MVFMGKIVYSANLMVKKCLSLTLAEKIYYESTLCLIKKFFGENNNVATISRENVFRYTAK